MEADSGILPGPQYLLSDIPKKGVVPGHVDDPKQPFSDVPGK
ncbi:hypothetical protein [Paenibacillus jilunlii]|nr:hypothetical protein [Paenibacillus jilunlii]